MSYSDYRAKARQILSGKWTLSIIVTFVAAFFGATMFSSNFSIDIDEDLMEHLPDALLQIYFYAVSILTGLSIVQFIFGGVVRQGYASYLLKLHDGEETDFRDLFSQFSNFGPAFILSLLQALFIFLWSLLLVIPGIVAAYSYAMAPYIMLEHPELSPRECLKASKELMRGHKGELFTLSLTFIGWNLLNILTLGIGSLWLDPYMNAAHVAFYRDISRTTVHTAPEEPWQA